MNKNTKPFNLDPKQLDAFVNGMLRNEVKQYIKLKSQTHPKTILKENFIFSISKEASKLYIQEIFNRKFQMRDDEMFSNKEIVAAITERHIFYSFKANDNERLALQNNIEYKEKLIHETIDDLIVNRYLGEVSYNVTTALYPPVSKIIVLNNLLYELFKTTNRVVNKDSKFIAIRNVFLRIIEQVKATSLLLDKYLIADAISIWRGLYESELTLVVLSYWDESISKEYLDFTEFQLLERNINLVDKTFEEVQEKLQKKAEFREVKVSNNFIHYGWLMQTSEFHDKKCKLNLKDGLAVVAEQHVKYSSYQLASNISHSPFFSKSLKEQQLLTYVVEMITYSLRTIFDSIINYLEESKLEINKDILNRFEKSQQQLLDMIKVMEENAK